MSAEFCDTNIFLYAFDLASPIKHARAQDLVNRIWQSGEGCLSVQVLQELYVNLTRKILVPLPPSEARNIVSDFTTWRVVEPKGSDVLSAIDLSIKSTISFWDALVVTAAQRAHASILWSEDLDHGQDFDGVVVRNPFRD